MRKDFNILGHLKSTFEIADTNLKVEVLHIKSKAYAKSYPLERHIAQTVSKLNCPDLIFAGHRHTGSYFVLNQMHCFEWTQRQISSFPRNLRRFWHECFPDVHFRIYL
jgi:hypothetical protein